MLGLVLSEVGGFPSGSWSLVPRLKGAAARMLLCLISSTRHCEPSRAFAQLHLALLCCCVLFRRAHVP